LAFLKLIIHPPTCYNWQLVQPPIFTLSHQLYTQATYAPTPHNNTRPFSFLVHEFDVTASFPPAPTPRFFSRQICLCSQDLFQQTPAPPLLLVFTACDDALPGFPIAFVNLSAIRDYFPPFFRLNSFCCFSPSCFRLVTGRFGPFFVHRSKSSYLEFLQCALIF